MPDGTGTASPLLTGVNMPIQKLQEFWDFFVTINPDFLHLTLHNEVITSSSLKFDCVKRIVTQHQVLHFTVEREISLIAFCLIAVHPRICREQILIVAAFCAYAGSSPHMQGTGLLKARSCISGRFIPAYAGNRAHSAARERSTPVHPRICREQIYLAFGITGTIGSSPHMQGTVLSSTSEIPHARFIPAYAGNRFTESKIMYFRAVHPRVCREQEIYKAEKRKNKIHPRICREQLRYWHPMSNIIGSSPHMQGTGRIFRGQCIAFRFIPAYAGNKWYIKQKIKKTRFIPAYARNSARHY